MVVKCISKGKLMVLGDQYLSTHTGFTGILLSTGWR